MDNDKIKNLKEALKHSPNNIPLKLYLAAAYFELNALEEAEKEYIEILGIENQPKAKYGLAEIYYKKEDYSTCNVILEEILDQEPEQFDYLLLYTRALVKEKDYAKALEIYKKIHQINPNFVDQALDQELKQPHSLETEKEEIDLDELFVQNPKINFDAVGGMEQVKKEIELKIIQPLKHPELYKAYGKKIGGGILLYGPPGCGKTHIARATAGQVNARFISVGLNDILDMWIGSSEKNLHAVFEEARANTPSVLFFDEIDALGASRSDMKQSSGRHLINQFLQELDGVESNNDGILILGATNAPWHLDTAFRRPGRFDRIIFVPPPDEGARAAIFQLKLKDKPLGTINYEKIAKKTSGFSGADIEAVIDRCIESKLEESFKTGLLSPIQSKDLLQAIKKQKASTKEWFSTAKNFALYANESGLYDDILSYLKIKK